MATPSLDDILRELKVSESISRATDDALANAVAYTPMDTSRMPSGQLPRLGYVFEVKVIESYKAFVARRVEGARQAFTESASTAFACWTALATVKSTSRTEVSAEGTKALSDEAEAIDISSHTLFAFHLAAAGLLAGRSPEARLELRRFTLTSAPPGWGELVAEQVLQAFVLLIRKQGGWSDIDQALERIAYLRGMQPQLESAWLDGSPTQEQPHLASILVGYYHLAQMITLVGRFLVEGLVDRARPGVGSSRVLNRLDSHRDRAEVAFDAGRNPVAGHIADLLWASCREVVQNSIWTHVETLGPSVKSLARQLARRGAERPVLDLWPSQQRALRDRLLDPYPQAILVEMPTSAGKTLLAKLSIVQTRALAPTGTIAYVVPTRALVNQITFEMRADFRGLGMRVEQAVPAFELDPTEERLLKNPPDILVTTPEKLDLLIRKDHPATAQLVLVIVDEAHNISDSGRGARLELLLGMIKRDRPDARFLLLSPFLPKSEELLSWLGDEKTVPPIRVEWRPARRIVGAVHAAGRGAKRNLVLETLNAVDNTDIRPGINIPLAPAPADNTISTIVRDAVHAFLDRGALLVLCRGPGSTETRAKELAESLPAVNPSPEMSTVIKFFESEWGGDSGIGECLRHGVAYHHAGISPEGRWLLESLIRNGHVKVVCGTTTLAQGVNFPISTVVVETLKKGDTHLSYSDFWNIAGRAGRALVDSVGVVAFPTNSKDKLEGFSEFLTGEAVAVSSQLATLLNRADEIGESFNLKLLYNIPELSPLLQFLAHALRVSGSSELATQMSDLEELMRASLVYHQVRRAGDEHVKTLLRICRAYLTQVKGMSAGTLTLADQTGFATPSVLRLLAAKSNDADFGDAAAWVPDNLFGLNTDPLTRRIGAIATIPEISLGDAEHAKFDPHRIAVILRDWVGGKSLSALARVHSHPNQTAQQFSRYLFSGLLGKASWGLGALEGICLAGANEKQWEAVGHIPSMVYFGVRTKEAVWLRMVGLPRLMAEGFASQWRKLRGSEPESFDDIRDWVSSLNDRQLSDALGKTSKLTPVEMKWIWKEFAG